MRWKLILPFITRCEAVVSTHHISSLPLLRSSVVTHVACIHYYHNSCCNLGTKLTLVNNQSMTLSRCNRPLYFTYIWTCGYAKGKDRGRDKKADKGITYIWTVIYITFSNRVEMLMVVKLCLPFIRKMLITSN
jgi:hypothetical protein